MMPSSSSLYNLNSNQLPLAKVQKSKSMGNFQQTENRLQPSTQVQVVNNNNMDLVQNVIYALTGVESKYFKKDVITGGLRLNAKTRMSDKVHSTLLRSGETAFYHKQVVSFSDTSTGQNPLGLLGQGLVTALKHELTKYYGMVAMLQEQVSFINLQRAISLNYLSHGFKYIQFYQCYSVLK